MPYIKYFEVIRDVIEENIGKIVEMRGITFEDAYSEVVGYLADNSNEWWSGQNPNINYKDPLCRIAYLYGTVPANANLLELVFDWDPELERYLDEIHKKRCHVDICAFGGGPGTELLGLAKRVEIRHESGNIDDQITLNFLLLDQVNEWADSWHAIKKVIDSRFSENISRRPTDWPLRVSSDFISIDITDTSNFERWGALFGKDLYIFSYVVSEIFDQYPDFKEFVLEMVSQTPNGSKFLFIDRCCQKWKDNIHNLAKDGDIVLSTFNETNDYRHYMSDDEQKDDLGKIYYKMGRSPRTTWDAFWVVGTKI